jgi:2-phosphoglycerate kinase
MTTSTMELYEALIQAGVDTDKARAAATAVMSKSEADDLVSRDKLDAVQQSIIAEIRDSRASTLQWVATMLVGQAAVIVALQQIV